VFIYAFFVFQILLFFDCWKTPAPEGQWRIAIAGGVLVLCRCHVFIAGCKQQRQTTKQRNNQTTEQPNNRTTSSCKFMHAHAAGCIFCKASLLHVAAFLGRFSAMLRMLQVQRQHVACATMMSNKICSCRSGIWSQVGAGGPKRYISALIGLSPHVVAGLK